MTTTSKKNKQPVNKEGKPDPRGFIPKKTVKSGKPMAIVANFYDVDADLQLSPELHINKLSAKEQKIGKKELEMKLFSVGNVFAAHSIEEVLEKGYGTTTKYWEYYKSTGVLRKCINMIANFSTRNGFETTIKCLDDEDDPKKEEYLEVKRKIDDLNRRVNMDDVLRITQIKRHIHGNAGWSWTTSKEFDEIMGLAPLSSSYITPEIDDKTGDFLGVNYPYAANKFIPKERLLYFSLDTIENNSTSLLGVSACRSIERNIKIKKNLERDLLYASRSLWAPIVIYNVDTRGLTAQEESDLFATLKTDLRPGAIIVTNRAVEHTVVQYNPDLNNLIRAIDKQDEEIIGNFGIPKALLSREKTMARATLEFSIKAFYESTIAGEQTYLKRQLEKQWYDPIVKALGFDDKIRIRHEWRPILQPDADFMQALVNAYRYGAVSAEEFFRRVGWELDRVEEEATPKEEESEGEKNE